VGGKVDEHLISQSVTKERLASFADSVFAVIITIMVLQLRMPAHATFAALLLEWPTALSYIVSYLLIVIMWINHHFLWGFAKHSTARLILWNFAHMFSASLVPFATAWVAGTRISAIPAFVYAGVIVMVNLSYHGFAYEVVHRVRTGDAYKALRRTALARSTLTLVLFTTAMLLSLKFPLIAFALVTCVLLTYARPEVPRPS
jgi:uncharacterized membrane protein